jgi:hypothetical protein
MNNKLIVVISFVLAIVPILVLEACSAALKVDP